MKKELKEAKIAKFQDQLDKAWKLIGQTPTGRDILQKASDRNIHYVLDFSLKTGDAGFAFTDSNGNKQVAINPMLVRDDSFGCFLETITHETIHASVDNKVDYIDHSPLDYCYLMQLDEANAVARTIQIAHEMDVLGISPILRNYVNGEASGSNRNPMGFMHLNTSNVYNYFAQSNPEYIEDGTAMRAAFVIRLTEERKRREHSNTYDEVDLKRIQNECIKCQNDPCVEKARDKTAVIESSYGKFLTNPEKLTSKDINIFSDWMGKNFLNNEDGSLKYLLNKDIKIDGLNGFAKRALVKTELMIKKARHELGLDKPSDNKAKINLAQTKMQKGR